MSALSKIRKAGFEISLSGDGFAVMPASLLNDSQRAFLKRHKAEIIEELGQEQAANDTVTPPLVMADDDAFFADDRRYCHECRRLVNTYCTASPTRYKPVDTHPRRCPDFK